MISISEKLSLSFNFIPKMRKISFPKGKLLVENYFRLRYLVIITIYNS